jgi:hypothetical protein
MKIKVQLLATGYIYKEKLPSIGNTLGSSLAYKTLKRKKKETFYY